MAVAGWRVWRRGGRASVLALRLFVVQLVLNVGWSVVFWLPGLAFGELLVLWGALRRDFELHHLVVECMSPLAETRRTAEQGILP